MVDPLTVFIGYDQTEDAAYDVCRASLLRHASRPLHIVKLDLPVLRRVGLYWREQHIDEGQRIDALDNKPFSSSFAFSRFLVPSLSLYTGYALFCDCDFLFTADVAELFDIAKAAPHCAVHVVKREHIPTESEKMNGAVQSAYPRKNWSSLALWRCDHAAHRFRLPPRAVNQTPGSWLHAFRWLDDDQIGGLPAEWNWLSGVDMPLTTTPKGIHFTLGVPGLHPGCDDAPYADLWRAEQSKLEKNALPIAGNSFADQT